MSMETYMKRLGWEFYQCGPNEGKWMKFDAEGNYLCQAGDEAWYQDRKNCSYTRV